MNPQPDSCSVVMIDPKYPHNVGNALRACALLGATTLYYTGNRVEAELGRRLPREERMAAYRRTDVVRISPGSIGDIAKAKGQVPVCVEIVDQAEDLISFVHPEQAVYVFGPEDGGVPKGIRTVCHRFVRIPSADPTERTPYNLAFSVGVVLYDRLVKNTHGGQGLRRYA